MTDMITITELGKSTGTPTKTIRYYEEIALIPKASRAKNGYRTYPKATILQLKHIRAARELHLPIKEIKTLMTGCEGRSCEHTKQYIQEEIDNYLKLLRKKIQQFVTLQQRLEHLRTNIDSCTSPDSTYCCNILQQLSEDTKGGETIMGNDCCGGSCSC